MPSGAPVMTVVVFGYRNEATILRAVGSVLEQETDDPVEVVVATSGGDRSAELVRRRFPAVAVTESTVRLFPGGTRNRGVAMARGELVAFLEADCVAAPGWVRGRIACHRAGHEAVAGAMAATPSDGRAGRTALYLLHPNRLVGHRAGRAHPYQAYGLSFSRRLLERAGPFDETLRTDEDTAMVERIRALGVEPWFDPGVVREHIGPATFVEMLRDQYARGRLDSWREILSLPAGRARRSWETTAGARSALVVARTARRGWKRARWTAAELRRGHAGPGAELVALLPAMAAGSVAYNLGWCVDQLRVVHRVSGGPRRDPAPAPSGVRRRVTASGDRWVALTFDDGPGRHTAAVLEELRRLGAPAAFFVTGAAARARPDDVRAIAAAGHVVGSAGWSGAPFTDMADGELDEGLSHTDALLQELTGRAVRHVGPPGGHYDERVVSALQRRGQQVWLWTTHPGEDAARTGAGDTVSGVVDRVSGIVDGLTPGAVLRLHDRDDDVDVAALPALVRRVRALGYELVTLDHPSGAADAGGDRDGPVPCAR